MLEEMGVAAALVVVVLGSDVLESQFAEALNPSLAGKMMSLERRRPSIELGSSS